jgi:hypothetical protein
LLFSSHHSVHERVQSERSPSSLSDSDFSPIPPLVSEPSSHDEVPGTPLSHTRADLHASRSSANVCGESVDRCTNPTPATPYITREFWESASMDDRSNRKRRLVEEAGPPGQVATSGTTSGSPAPFTPPSNKRQFTGSGNSSPLNSAKEDPETMTAAEVRIRFRVPVVHPPIFSVRMSLIHERYDVDHL